MTEVQTRDRQMRDPEEGRTPWRSGLVRHNHADRVHVSAWCIAKPWMFWLGIALNHRRLPSSAKCNGDDGPGSTPRVRPSRQ